MSGPAIHLLPHGTVVASSRWGCEDTLDQLERVRDSKKDKDALSRGGIDTEIHPLGRGMCSRQEHNMVHDAGLRAGIKQTSNLNASNILQTNALAGFAS